MIFSLLPDSYSRPSLILDFLEIFDKSFYFIVHNIAFLSVQWFVIVCNLGIGFGRMIPINRIYLTRPFAAL